jgi:hypothetical protein
MRSSVFVPRLRRSFYPHNYPDLTVGPIKCRPFGPFSEVLQLAQFYFIFNRMQQHRPAIRLPCDSIGKAQKHAPISVVLLHSIDNNLADQKFAGLEQLDSKKTCDCPAAF